MKSKLYKVTAIYCDGDLARIELLVYATCETEAEQFARACVNGPWAFKKPELYFTSRF